MIATPLLNLRNLLVKDALHTHTHTHTQRAQSLIGAEPSNFRENPV
jgi:hypothetical protein